MKQIPRRNWQSIEARVWKAMVLPVALLLLPPDARAQCGAAGSDNFSDNSVDATKWGADFYYTTSHAQLTEANGRLEYTAPGVTASSTVYRPWKLNCGSYLSDWEVQVDANLGGVVLSQNHSHVELDLMVANQATISSLPNVTFFYVALDLFRDSLGVTKRSVGLVHYTNGVAALSGNGVVTSSQNVSLRISFDSKAKTLTAWYDEDGPGYRWTPLQTNRIDAAGIPWNLDASSRFQALVGGSSDGIAITSSDLVFADNFTITSAPCYSRFIHTERKANGVLGLTLEGNGQRFDLERANTFLDNPSNWETIATFTNTASGMPEYIDVTATNVNPHFYRAVLKEP